ncbi:MAG: ATP synthase F1 subunit delta [Candidatus Marinimicrobia bacterium]|nr:ATP synthase F1 subunit delta [Candidatus Neomarinimicrobiota bacterium]MBT5955310.1 ATP synthase F1 subunit delta [Candidatus Neomarinimicrobiota bacterium]
MTKKYARALYNVAVQQKDVKEVSNRINYIVDVMKAVPEFSQLLQTHQVSTEDKITILKNVLKDNISSLEVELISDILEHNNILILSDIAKHFEYLVETDSNLVNMTITSAKELSAEEVDHIQSSIESQLNKKVDVRTETDKSLIGGVRLRVGNIVIDNTISRRLDMLKNTLTQA